jgi:mono/diheme cytochrome c family protein
MRVVTIPVALMLAVATGRAFGANGPQAPRASAPVAAEPRALLDKYCVACHNDRLKTAGLMLDRTDLSQVGSGAEMWEKVLRKLRAGMMPPAGRPRPDKPARDAFVAWLEAEIDRTAAARPNPGPPSVHRLNRTEYGNAIRDLLALDVDTSVLLPGDDAAFGFDNIADLLKVSPVLLDGYLAAANKISRLAVGDPAVSLGSAGYNVSKLMLQQDRMNDDLPFGSRGGLAVRHFFPYDGEYVIKIRVNGPANPPQAVEVRVDGTRVAQLPTVGREDEEPWDKGAVETRVPIKAGPRVLGVSFVRQAVAPENRYPQYYPWGNSANFYTNTGAVRYLNVTTVDVSGPFNPGGPGDTPSRRRIFVCRPATAHDEEPCASRILAQLARRAYRRPVADRDVEPLMAFFRSARSKGDFDAGIRLALERLLADPSFLFRVEQDAGGEGGGRSGRVSDMELASRLSFFLWSSIPDDELLQVAEQGVLRDPAVLDRQVRRMAADRRSKMLVTNFGAQWLYLRNVKQAKPDTYSFPDWDDDLRESLAQETELFLQSQVRDDRSLMDLLTANYTFVNERLARHYGLPNVYGERFRRVTLPDTRRAGLLGHASILTVTSQPNRTSPVLRGKWLLENLLGAPPPPPPPDVPALPEGQKDEPKTMRERMEQHRRNPVCASCHAVMDPLGFSLENFDAIGKWRSTADGQQVDVSGSLPDGSTFTGPDGLRRMLESRREDFVLTVVEKLLTYALGRGVEYYDMPAVRKIVREAAGSDYRWSSIILGIARSNPFQSLGRAVS